MPTIEPIERSMLRDTMISTMPVAMIAMDDDWTERFQRLRDVRNRPPDRKLKPTQMIARAMSMPTRRESTSATWTRDPNVRRGRSLAGISVSTVTSVMVPFRAQGSAPCIANATQGA